jgi:hypothetical protein
MSQTALERRHFPVPTRWPRAGNDLDPVYAVDVPCAL